MINIIDILNQATKPIRVSEAYLSVSKKTMPYWDKIGEVFPTKFLNELDDLESELCNLICEEHFERGFWLGLRLGQFAEQGPSGGVRNP